MIELEGHTLNQLIIYTALGNISSAFDKQIHSFKTLFMYMFQLSLSQSSTSEGFLLISKSDLKSLVKTLTLFGKPKKNISNLIAPDCFWSSSALTLISS